MIRSLLIYASLLLCTDRRSVFFLLVYRMLGSFSYYSGSSLIRKGSMCCIYSTYIYVCVIALMIQSNGCQYMCKATFVRRRSVLFQQTTSRCECKRTASMEQVYARVLWRIHSCSVSTCFRHNFQLGIWVARLAFKGLKKEYT